MGRKKKASSDKRKLEIGWNSKEYMVESVENWYSDLKCERVKFAKTELRAGKLVGWGKYNPSDCILLLCYHLKLPLRREYWGPS